MSLNRVAQLLRIGLVAATTLVSLISSPRQVGRGPSSDDTFQQLGSAALAVSVRAPRRRPPVIDEGCVEAAPALPAPTCAEPDR